MVSHVQVANLGQIRELDVQFGDLTVLVGPQATGKSVFLQLLKLLVDKTAVLNELRRFNIDWDGKIENFLELYFGEGMSAIYDADSTNIVVDGERTAMEGLRRRSRSGGDERLFFIPAQRVLSLREGLTRPFTDYRTGDPFVVREFSEKLHQLVQTEFAQTPDLFPKSNRLKKELRDLLDQHIFGGFGLKTSTDRFQKRMVLNSPTSNANLPYLVWSAGQREFVPLLLGLYWLIPPAKTTRRDKLEWVVIEELEMGLHPNAISVTLLLVMELLARGYRVCLSTHSPHVLDVVWALRVIREQGGSTSDVLDLFDLPRTSAMKAIAESALNKEIKVYYFQRGGTVHDISRLDPGAEDTAESGWGGLSEFSGRVGEVVARVAAKHQMEIIS
jgi:energy-coupling factor transporter ATP-binding protein EcfA2